MRGAALRATENATGADCPRIEIAPKAKGTRGWWSIWWPTRTPLFVRAGGRPAESHSLTDPLDPYAKRPTGRGSVDDSDEPLGRKFAEPEPLVKQQPWEPMHLDEEQTRNNPQVIPVQSRPDVILRFSDAKTLLLDGLLDKASSIAEHAIVVNAHLGQGNVLLFGNNPVYRGETVGTYALVFNAILNYQHLAHESLPSNKQPPVNQAIQRQETVFGPSPISEREAGR